jgi:hypothetical protein
MFSKHEVFISKSLTLPPQTLMSWNWPCPLWCPNLKSVVGSAQVLLEFFSHACPIAQLKFVEWSPYTYCHYPYTIGPMTYAHLVSIIHPQMCRLRCPNVFGHCWYFFFWKKIMNQAEGKQTMKIEMSWHILGV